MEYAEELLDSAIKELFSGQDYERLFAFYGLWFDIRQTYRDIPSDPLMDKIWEKTREMNLEDRSPWGKLTQPTARLVVRFASDAESDLNLARHSPGLQTRLCKRILQEFFSINMWEAYRSSKGCGVKLATMHSFYLDAALIAHWANLGCVEEHAIRNHILQSLISHPQPSSYRADALYILFKTAGATFDAYVEASVIDRCFEFLEDQYYGDPEKEELTQVSARSVKQITSKL